MRRTRSARGAATGIAAAIGVLCAGCSAPEAVSPPPAAIVAVPAQADSPAPLERTTLPVKGMTCGACSRIIKDELKKLRGVVTVEADYEKGTATVTWVKGQVTLEQIVEAINRTGFKASLPPPAGNPSR